MKTTHSLTPRLPGLFALLAVVPSFAAGACGGSSNVGAPNTSGKSGSSSGTSGSSSSGGKSAGGWGGRGGTNTGGNGGTSGGTGGGTGGTSTEDGGQGGEPSGGSSGTAGAGASSGGAGQGGSAGQGASAGQGGSSGQGATAGQGAGAGQGGDAGASGGQSGAAGNGTAGTVGVLGTPCSPPGALACAGNHQKLTVVCGGDGEWETNETCGTDLFCESTPGPNVGTCQPVAEGCEVGPSTAVCEDDDKHLIRCSADATTTTRDECDGGCHNGECREVSECPVWEDYDNGAACSLECGPSPGGDLCFPYMLAEDCMTVQVWLGLGQTYVIRTTWADETCEMCGGSKGIVSILPEGGGFRRVSVPAPWSLETSPFNECRDLVENCRVFDLAETPIINVVSSTLADSPVNIVIEAVDASATCPTE